MQTFDIFRYLAVAFERGSLSLRLRRQGAATPHLAEERLFGKEATVIDGEEKKTDSRKNIRLDDSKWVKEQLSYRLPIPVKAIGYFPRMNPPTSFPICPRCNITLEREFQSYCDRCGQYLNWRKYGKRTTIVIIRPKPDEDKGV